jgi:predicted metal-dependent enzyme (double-stranded beta helix superfamily)
MAVTFQEGTVINPRIERLAQAINRDLRTGGKPAAKVAATVESLLKTLDPAELHDGLEKVAVDTGYSQSCVYLDPDSRFSMILLIWKDGQFTPVHNHRTWGVVTVLEGAERETQYEPLGRGEDMTVRESSDELFRAGEVCWFDPPDDIHRVENGGGTLAMSLHIYGCDYREKPTSILQCFDDAIDMV